MAEHVDYLKSWMGSLPDRLKEIPIINLAIPGSHDSMSYGIRPNANIAPDAEPVVNKLYKVMPCVVRRWAITQRLNAVQQLIHGIRYKQNPFENLQGQHSTFLFFVSIVT